MSESNVCSNGVGRALWDAAVPQLKMLDEIAASGSVRELLDAIEAEERITRCTAAALHPLLTRLAAEGIPAELGGSSMKDVVSQRLHISTAEAGRRLKDAAMLGPRQSFTGEPLEPQWAGTAAALADGAIGPEHVAIIRTFHNKVPSWVDAETREHAEHTLANIAREHLPKELQASADLLLLCLNPDGDFSEEDRKKKRGITIHPQDIDGMSKISGWIDPELRAAIEAVLAVTARYGQNNPDNPGDGEQTLEDALAEYAAAHAKRYPPDDTDTDTDTDTEAETVADSESAVEAGVEEAFAAALARQFWTNPDSPVAPADFGATPLASEPEPEPEPEPVPVPRDLLDEAVAANEAAQRDPRSQAQRNHDAFTVVFRRILSTHTLPTNRGAPTTVVLTMTIQQLMKGAGHVLTATGTRLLWPEVIRLAKNSYPVLVVFDEHTGQPLYLGRSKRIATYWQWLALFARDRGCCRPGCTIAAVHCEVHHHPEFSEGGQTDVDSMSLNCTCDHRLLSLGFKTRMRPDGRVEWQPPEWLDGGRARVNDYWFPENFLLNAEQRLKPD